MIISEQEYLEHYGTPRHSGRYPWGSGGDNETSIQRNKHLLNYVDDLKKQGLSETEIAKGLGMSTTQLRAQKSIAKNEVKQHEINQAQGMKDRGWSNVEIGKRMGLPESSVRSLLTPGAKDKADVIQTTSSMLKGQVDSKKAVDIGRGVENQLGVSKERLAASVAVLQEQGYQVHSVQVQQLGTGNKTTIKVLAVPGTTYRDLVSDTNQIKLMDEFSDDGGRTFKEKIQPPMSISSKRVDVRYAEQGGGQADGVIYVRPGVEDISLGGTRYAQVRIAVDGSHYIKGMAMYKDDLPDGVDLQFNTNKSNTGKKHDVFKELNKKQDGTVDQENPFGAQISRQVLKDLPDGKKELVSTMNIVNEAGDWQEWSRNLSSQMLSKQSPVLAKSQLDMTYEQRKNGLDEIMSLTNPAVKKKLLETYADTVDSAAVHLQAHNLPKQATHVILPVNDMKETEIYAPNYDNGTRVALIRYPHGGTFEIPELVVNNKNPAARKAIGTDSPDAVGIHSKVAERLSGADFDGDTVVVIPNDKGQIRTSPALEGLKNFDPKRDFPKYDGMQVMSEQTKQHQMGVVSNLITDMTIRKASNDELARAVRHSMVVIDAVKHELDWKGSERENGISALRKKYQPQPGGRSGGASTLISRAGAEQRVPKRKPRPASLGGPIDPLTGNKVYVTTAKPFVNKAGKTVTPTQRSQKLAETPDAFTLSSGTRIEGIYAQHSNSLKALANKARLESLKLKPETRSSSATKAYAQEVASLDAKLNRALKNAPRERQAQVLANSMVAARRQANPDMDNTQVKKVKAQALETARIRTGANKYKIKIEQSEWDAIQANAISNNKLVQILNNADLKVVKELAQPKSAKLMTPSKIARAQQMLDSHYTQAEVAKALGVSLTTLKEGTK